MTPPQTPARYAGSLAGLAWVALPFIAYVAVLSRLWFNAPIWDDYDAILKDTMLLLDAPSLREWGRILVMLHNEHRIAMARLGAWALATLTGEIDFRLLVAFGAATLFGMAALMWAEFRREVTAPVFAAAGFLLFQLSYYEAALMGSAALANVTVVTFSFAALFFAARKGWPAMAATVLFGVLAAGCMANGLFAMTIAALGAAFMRRRAPALLYGAIALALWVLYFTDYRSPVAHPSPLAALKQPITAIWLGLVNLGAIGSGVRVASIAGVVMFAALAWLLRKRFWVGRPVAAMWVAFVVLSLAAITAGRAGFGVGHGPRYAVYSSALVAVMLLSACALTRPWTTRRVVAAIAAAAAVSVVATFLSWPATAEYSFNGKRLVKAVPAATEKGVYPYFGVLYPAHPEAWEKLARAEQRGLYTAPTERLFLPAVRIAASLPANARIAGHVDRVDVDGSRLYVTGWTDIPASVPQRTFSVVSADNMPKAGPAATRERVDVARATARPHLRFAGFQLELEYPSEEHARRAAQSVCIAVEAPGAGTAVLVRNGTPCNTPLSANGARLPT